MTEQEVQKDVDLLLQQLPRFDNPYNRKLLIAGCFAMGKLAVNVFQDIQHTLRTNDAIATQAFLKAHPAFRVQGNAPLLAEAASKVTNPSVENILQAFEQVKGLTTSVEYTEAFADFFHAHPELDQAQANVSVLSGALAKAGDEVSLEALEDLLHPGNPNFVGDRLVLNPVWEAQVQEQHERDRLIQEISQGRPTYTSRDQYDGHVVTWKTSELAEESMERLRWIASYLEKQRAEVHSTKEQLQKQNREADAAKLQALMDNYPRLPSSMFIGGVETVLDSTFFKRLANTDFEYFKKFKRDYGDKQIDARLRGE